jgi:hypothetical protein
MSSNKKTYKTKEVNIVKLSAFYEEVTSKLKKKRNGKTSTIANTSNARK